MNHSLLTDEVLNDPEKAAAYVFQFRQLSPNKAVVIVESSRDALVLFDALNELNITLLAVRGKPKCIEVVENTTASGISGCVALVDADFDRTQWRNLPNVPVVLTDYHDLECYAIFSENWIRALREIIDLGKLDKQGIGDYEQFQNVCVELCIPLGAVLLSNNLQDHGVDFKEYDFGNKCQVKNFSNDVPNVVRRLQDLNAKSITVDKKCYTSLSKFASQILDTIDSQHLLHLVSSKMVCNCIFGLAKSIGLMQSAVILDSETLRRWFRSQIRPQDLQNSLMWQELIAWLTAEGLSTDRKRP